MQNPTSQIAQSGKAAAVATAKRIAQENLEFLKSARQQIAPSVETPQPASNQNVVTDEQRTDNNVDPQLEAKIKADTAATLAKLEQEVQQFRIKRAQEQMQRLQQPQQEPEQNQTQVELPKGKMRKIFGGMKQKLKEVAGKRETQKNASG